MSLKEVLCQDKAIEKFQRSLRLDRLSHAYIFAGPDGVGRYQMAKEWAKVLLCNDQLTTSENGETFYDSCGKCSSCLLFEGDGHPDFKHVYKELIRFTKNPANKNKTPIELPKDVIQEFVIDQVANKPKTGDKVIYIISEAEKLNAASQNALLKTLEEPPAHCVLILLCTRLDKLLPTTLSRCQVVRFGPVDENIIVEKLSSQGTPETQSLFWARFTDGSLGSSLHYAALSDGEANLFKTKRELVSRLSQIRLEDCLDFAKWICSENKAISKKWVDSDPDVSKSDISRKVQKTVTRVILSAFSDVMKLHLGCNEKIVNIDQLDQIQRLAEHFDAETAAEMVEKAYKSTNWIDSSVNEKLIFEELLLNIAGSARM